MIEFDVSLAHVLGMLLSVVFPLIVGLVTKTVTNSGHKALLLAAIAAVSGVVSEALTAVQADQVFNLGMALFVALTSFIAAVGMHFGLYKPLGVSQRLQEVGSDSR